LLLLLEKTRPANPREMIAFLATEDAVARIAPKRRY
jgi:hypothetical protein